MQALDLTAPIPGAQGPDGTPLAPGFPLLKVHNDDGSVRHRGLHAVAADLDGQEPAPAPHLGAVDPYQAAHPLPGHAASPVSHATLHQGHGQAIARHVFFAQILQPITQGPDDGARTTVEAYQESLQGLCMSTSTAQAQAGHARLAAPSSGVVTKRWSDPGDLAVPGKPILTIEDTSRYKVLAPAAPQGGVSSILRVAGEDGFPVRARYEEPFRDSPAKLAGLKVHWPSGEIPLAALGTINTSYVPALLTRQAMQNTIDVFGYRERAALSHIMANVQKALRGIQLPRGYKISQEGDAKQGAEHYAALMSALGIGMVLLYFSLVPAFRSFINPLTIMSSIPLALIGAVWSLLLLGKHQSTTAFMGVILLSGIVVKNSILLIDFIEVAKKQGASTLEALRGSVRVRTRPILMTAFGTAVGMVPIALERAIGLERLSPLPIAAIGGLMVSTFLTLLYVPIFYTIFEEMRLWLRRIAVKRG